jgi:hypothetical protein
MLLKLTAM